MSKEAMKLIRDAIEQGVDLGAIGAKHILDQAIAEAEKQEGQSNFCPQCEALARELKAVKQEQGEPYGYLKLNTGKFVNEVEGLNPMKDKRYLPLYATQQQQRKWVGLAEKEVREVWSNFNSGLDTAMNFYNAVENKLKEKNT